jgi:hypothetical protein
MPFRIVGGGTVGATASGTPIIVREWSPAVGYLPVPYSMW